MDPFTKNRFVFVGSALGLFVLTVIGVTIVVYIFMGDNLTPPERARVILSNAPLIDGKNDVAYYIRKYAYNDLSRFNFSTNVTFLGPWKMTKALQTDLGKLRNGVVGTQIWVARADCESQYKDAVAITLDQIDLIKRIIANYSDVLTLVNITEDITKANEDGKIGSLISIEGGHSIQSSLGILRQYYDLGVRMMTLAKGCSTPWIDFSKVDHANKTQRALPYNQGITTFGEDVVAEMNRLGIIVDLSDSSRSAMVEVLAKSKAPIVFSHSAARNICDSDHNLTDDILTLVHEKHAVVMITFDANTITCGSTNSTIHHVIEHIEYIKAKTSVDNIGIGSNFDGMDNPVKGLEDASKFPDLFAELVDAGWDYGDLEKIAGKNFMRVFEEVEKVRDELQDDDPIQTYVERKKVKRFWDQDNCTSRYGIFPPDLTPSFGTNSFFPKNILEALG